MRSPKYWITHNWHLKIVSLILATMLGDMTNTVQVRLRGSSNLIKDVTAKDVSTTIDLSKMGSGEKSVPLSPQNVQAPFGAEVIRVNPSSVRFNLERTVTRSISVAPKIVGQLPDGYETGKVSVSPATMDIEGPESRVNSLSSIATVAIHLDQKRSTIEQTADLDLPDPQIRLQHPSPVNVRIEIHRKRN
jgi:YbbR domain-containing protein